MKILKKIGFVLLVLIALFLIIPLFVQKDFIVSRTVSIKKAKTDVFDYARFLENQADYVVWLKKDPKATVEGNGVDGTVGYISSWESNREEIGVGEQEITGIKEGERIDFAFRYKEPQEMQSTAHMEFESAGEASTKVSWTFKSSMPYPWNIFNLFVDKDQAMGPDLEKGLNNMKEILESEIE